MARKNDRKRDAMANFLATDRVPDTLFGFKVVSRDEDYTQGDLDFFDEHPDAGGYYDMGGEDPDDSEYYAPSAGDDTGSADGPRIVINPTTFDNDKDALCVAMNEAFRILMEQTEFEPMSEPTDAQRKFFSDTAYAGDETMLRRTIVSRIATFDTSVKDPTDDQMSETVEFLRSVLENGAPQNEWEQSAVQRIVTVLEKALEAKGAQPAEEPPAEEPPAEEPPAEEPPAEEPPAVMADEIGGTTDKELDTGITVNEDFGKSPEELEGAKDDPAEAERWKQWKDGTLPEQHSQEGVTWDGFKKGVDLPDMSQPQAPQPQAPQPQAPQPQAPQPQAPQPRRFGKAGIGLVDRTKHGTFGSAGIGLRNRQQQFAGQPPVVPAPKQRRRTPTWGMNDPDLIVHGGV